MTGKDWTKTFKAIFDTGSPTTLIPKFIWKDISCKFLSPKDFGILGISPSNTEKIPTKLGEITCVFIDKEKISYPFEVKSRLLPDDNNPLIIGFLDVLDKFKLVCDYKKNSVYIEM